MKKILWSLLGAFGFTLTLTAIPPTNAGASTTNRSRAPVIENGFVKTASQIEKEKKLQAIPKYDGENCGCSLKSLKKELDKEKSEGK